MNSQQTTISKFYPVATIDGIKEHISIDVDDFLENTSNYFGDEELIKVFDITKTQIAWLEKEIGENFDKGGGTSRKDLIWNGIGQCWTIITKNKYLDLPVITPWTLESTRDDEKLQRFLGSPRTILKIKVTMGDILPTDFDYHTFVHDCTEELTLGLLIGSKDNKNFTLYIEEVYEHTLGERGEISLDELLPNFIEGDVIKKRYTCDTNYGKITFDTLDFIQGVITAASWLNVDPHLLIDNVLDRNSPVNF